MSAGLEENSHNEAVLELNLFLTVCAVPHLDHTCSDTCSGTSSKMGLNLNFRAESAALKNPKKPPANPNACLSQQYKKNEGLFVSAAVLLMCIIREYCNVEWIFGHFQSPK